MSIYVIGDLHLSTNSATNKSMEVFGKRWIGYIEKLEKNWRALISPEDTVIIPGDISWALKLEEAYNDLDLLNKLPGHKLIGKGNHDFWWTTTAKMNRFFIENGFDTIKILYNNAFIVEKSIISGTRGWFLEQSQQIAVGTVDYAKIVDREVLRLRLSLDEAVRLQKESCTTNTLPFPIAVFLHFPPVWLDFVCREFVDVLHEYSVQKCYFGHIHGAYNIPRSFNFENIDFSLISSDSLNFIPAPVFLN